MGSDPINWRTLKGSPFGTPYVFNVRFRKGFPLLLLVHAQLSVAGLHLMCDLVAGCCRTHRRRTGFFTDARIDRCLRCCRFTVIHRCCVSDSEAFTHDAQRRNSLGDVGRHKDFRRTAVGNLLQCIEALQLQHTLADLRTIQTLDTTCLRLIDEVDTLRLTFRQGDLCISLRLRGDDLACWSPFALVTTAS